MTVQNNIAVKFDGVQKTYDGKNLVVKNLNLDIPNGEFLTLLGPSGSGKTTVLMMLAGFEVPTSGNIFLNNAEITKVSPHKRGIGMVFQDYALFPHMTVGENLAYPLKVRKIPQQQRAEMVKKALAMVRLGEFSNRRPGQLSGGQKQRVAVARALVFEPQIVLMDEPLGALDKNLREEMQYEIKHIHENLGITIVYVTHDQGEALTMSTQVAVFQNGIIQQMDPPNTLYEHPKNPFVAGFIGENNQLSGTVESIKEGGCDVRLQNGAIIHAINVCECHKGQQTMLSIRPERVSILQNEKEGEDNSHEAQIKESIYLGDHFRLRVAMFGQDDFIIKIRNTGDISNLLKLNQVVKLTWKRADCHSLGI